MGNDGIRMDTFLMPTSCHGSMVVNVDTEYPNYNAVGETGSMNLLHVRRNGKKIQKFYRYKQLSEDGDGFQFLSDQIEYCQEETDAWNGFKPYLQISHYDYLIQILPVSWAFYREPRYRSFLATICKARWYLKTGFSHKR